MRKGNNIPTSRKQKKKTSKKIACLVIAGPLITSIAALASFSLGSSLWQQLIPAAEQRNNAITKVHGSNVVVIHNHVLLNIRIDDKTIAIPADVGILQIFYGDHSLDQFGMQNPPMAPLHTHDSDGVIHIESRVARDYTIGQFLDIWGFNLDRTTSSVKMIVNGQNVENHRNHGFVRFRYHQDKKGL